MSTPDSDSNPTFNPWVFVPLLYFMQALPVAIVQELAVIVYKDLGIANESITRWTSLIALPWSMQMLFGPLVDLNFTKRKWILGGQAVIVACLLLAAFSLKLPNAFGFSLVLLALTALFSALCNIATDGFAILSMTRQQQAQFAGIMSTFYRLGRLFVTALLVFVAGLMLKRQGADPATVWMTVLATVVGMYAVGSAAAHRLLPRPPGDEGRDLSKERASPETVRSILRSLLIVLIGVAGYFMLNSIVRLSAHGLWRFLDGGLSGSLLGWKLPEKNLVLGFDLGLPSVGVEIVQLAFCAVFVVWAFAMARRMIVGTEVGEALGSFVRQAGFPAILFFILFYRFGEAVVGKITPLFLKDSVTNGGLAVPNEQLGILSGLFGVVGIILGGIVGGVTVSKLGLRRSFWPLALAMHVPNLLYLGLAKGAIPMFSAELSWPGPFNATLASILFVDQFGYGFGFAGYMVYLMWVAQRGRFPTSHYAIGTGMGALCIAIAGVLSGVIQNSFGYAGVFLGVIFMSIPGLLSILFIPLEDSHKAIKVSVD